MIRFWKESLTHVAALFTTVEVFIFLGILSSSFFLLLMGADPMLVCLRASGGVASLLVVLFLLRIPAVKEHMEIMKQDNLTIANHWAKHKHLVRLTWYLRAGYVISAISVRVGVVLWCQYDMFQINDFLLNLSMKVPDVAHQNMIFERLFNTKAFPFFMFGLSFFFVTRTVQFVAACHIIFYRNNPVRNVFTAMCKEYYKYGGTVIGVGTPLFGTGAMMMTSSPMFFPANHITNFVNIYIPMFHGDGFPVGTITPQLRNVYLLQLPNYNPLDHVGPENIMDPALQEQFMIQNMQKIRKTFSTTQLQVMGVDPSLISNSHSGRLVKKGG